MLMRKPDRTATSHVRFYGSSMPKGTLLPE